MLQPKCSTILIDLKRLLISNSYSDDCNLKRSRTYCAYSCLWCKILVIPGLFVAVLYFQNATVTEEIYKLKDPPFIGYIANCIQSDVSDKYGFVKKISKIVVVD